jgi:hypothetical protein
VELNLIVWERREEQFKTMTKKDKDNNSRRLIMGRYY